MCIWIPTVVCQHSSKSDKQGWLTRWPPWSVLGDTVPLFVYTDQLLCHCVFIYSNVCSWLVYLVGWLFMALLLVGWVIWNNKPLSYERDVQFWRIWETPLKQTYRLNAVIYSSETELTVAKMFKIRSSNPIQIRLCRIYKIHHKAGNLPDLNSNHFPSVKDTAMELWEKATL